MNIKTLEDIGEKYNINQVLSALIIKKNNNLLFEYIKSLSNNYEEIKQNSVLLCYIVKYEIIDIIELLFEGGVSFDDKILTYIGQYGSENILKTKYFNTLEIFKKLKICGYAAWFKKMDFIKNIMEPKDKNKLLFYFNLLLDANNTDKSTYSDVIEFISNL